MIGFYKLMYIMIIFIKDWYGNTSTNVDTIIERIMHVWWILAFGWYGSPVVPLLSRLLCQ